MCERDGYAEGKGDGTELGRDGPAPPAAMFGEGELLACAFIAGVPRGGGGRERGEGGGGREG